jgi:hypothetical protein
MRKTPLLLPLLCLSLTACPSKPKPDEAAGPSADAGRVSVTAAGISLGEERLGNAPADALEKVDPLFRRLKERREEWKMAHPGEAFPGTIAVELAPELSCQASMSVYMTAMFAGYPHITLKQGALVVDIPAEVPRPPSLEEPSPNAPRQAFVVFGKDGSVELKPSRCLGAFDVVPDAALPATVKEWCGEKGDCLGATHVRCEAGVPMSRVLAAIAELRKGAAKMHLGTAAACKPGDTSSDLFGGIGGMPTGLDGALPWGQEPTAAPVAAPKPPSTPARGKARVATVREGMVTVVGGLSQDEVREAMKPKLESLKACYEAGTINNPNLEGRVSVRVEVGKKGGVMSAKNGGSDLPDTGVTRCVVGVVQEMAFPAKGALSQVVYPVMFQMK